MDRDHQRIQKYQNGMFSDHSDFECECQSCIGITYLSKYSPQPKQYHSNNCKCKVCFYLKYLDDIVPSEPFLDTSQNEPVTPDNYDDIRAPPSLYVDTLPDTSSPTHQCPECFNIHAFCACQESRTSRQYSSDVCSVEYI